MNVYLTFDVEVWCASWDTLDESFPSCFQRYIYGRSKAGDYALPLILSTLCKHGLRGVFFIEPLFAARFGQQWLDVVVDMIKSNDHDVQLHLHPEWSDEIDPLIFPGATAKRQHLCYYTREEQEVLVGLGVELMRKAGCADLRSFRAGSFAANRDTYVALNRRGFTHDSSAHVMYEWSGPDMREEFDIVRPFVFEEVSVLPMTVFRDGFGRLRPAQVGSASFTEMRAALESAYSAGVEHFVILSHNFELLKVGKSKPDSIVASRFERLCRYLGEHADRLPCCALADARVRNTQTYVGVPPRVSRWATALRYAGQIVRRAL